MEGGTRTIETGRAEETHLIGDVLANLPLHGGLHLVLPRNLLGRESGGSQHTANVIPTFADTREKQGHRYEESNFTAGVKDGHKISTYFLNMVAIAEGRVASETKLVERQS